MESAHREGIERLRPGSASWPQELDAIDGPPEQLWLRGRASALRFSPRVALVGSRSPTPYGTAQAERFATRLALAGVCVVSGLARGIDQAAHAAALEAEGACVAVLGSGVDRPWPDVPLARALAQQGALLSEHPPGTGPRRHHFPRRNRIISGLAQAVIVIEAAHASGSLITARWAADQGRSVYAVPGRVDHPMARGCHRLLREGAQLVEDPEEVLRDLGLAPGGDSGSASHAAQPASSSPLLRALHGETLDADELAQRCRRELCDVLVELVQLELAGRVARCPGGLWRRLE